MKIILVLVAIVVFAFADEEIVLPFLESATEKAVNEFKKILLRAGDRTEDQFMSEVEAWVAKQTPKIKVIINIYFFFDVYFLR